MQITPWKLAIKYSYGVSYIYLAPGGGCEILFSPDLSVCVCLCLCVYLCVRPIFWYFISRLLEEISIWNWYRILIGLFSILEKIDLHRSKVKVTGTVHWFLKVQSVISQKLSHRKIVLIVMVIATIKEHVMRVQLV